MNEQGSEIGRNFKLHIRIGIVESTDKDRQANKFVGCFMEGKYFFLFWCRSVCAPNYT